MAPTTPTYHPYSQSNRPDVLDIALVKVPLPVTVTNLNDLSSDHNPVLLVIHGTPIASTPPSPKRFINWRKYTDFLENQPVDVNPSTTNPSEVDGAIDNFTSSINSAIQSSSTTMKPRHRTNALPSYIIEEINRKNRLRREWQLYRDPAIKRRLNSKIKFVRTMMSTHRQDEWDQFLDTRKHKDNSLYKLNKSLLHKRPASHPLSGPNGLVFQAIEKAELIADSLALQFTPNPGQVVPEVSAYLLANSTTTPCHNTFTSPGQIMSLVSKLPKHKAPGEDTITNTALRFLPKNMILALTKIINGCLKLCYFPTAWKRATIISIPKPGKDLLKPDGYRPIALLSSI